MKRPKPTVPDPQVLKDTAGDPSKTGLLPHLKLSPDAKVPDVFFPARGPIPGGSFRGGGGLLPATVRRQGIRHRRRLL
jgi:hypothetical protein